MLRPSKRAGSRISLLEPVEVGRPVLVPLGDEHERVGALGRAVHPVGEEDAIAVDRLHVRHRLRIVRLHRRARREQIVDAA